MPRTFRPLSNPSLKMKPLAAPLRKLDARVINLFSVSQTTLRLREAVQKQRVFTVAILAVTCVAVAITFILAGTNESRHVSASVSGYSSAVDAACTPLDDKHAQVTATLPMFQRLDQNYTRGAEPASGGIETLQRLGIKTVVDLRSIYDHTDNAGLAAEQAGLRYYWLPMGVWNPPTDAQAKEFVALVTDESK